DKVLRSLMPDRSRSQLQDWIKQEHVFVNDEPVKPNYKVQKGDQIGIKIPEVAETDMQAEPIDLEIVYEDADVAVVNKPQGMVVHPAAGHASGTLVNA